MKDLFRTWFYINRKGDTPVLEFLESVSHQAQIDFVIQDEVNRNRGFFQTGPDIFRILPNLYGFKLTEEKGSILVFYYTIFKLRIVYLHAHVENKNSLSNNHIRIAIRRLKTFMEEYHG